MTTSVSNSLILRGILAVIVGILALAWPGVTLALLFGLFNLISGVTLITRGFEIRRAGQSLHSVLHKAA